MKKLTLENGKVIEISDESYKALSDGIREKRWVPELNQNYWYVMDTYKVNNDGWCDTRYDKLRLNTGNCFATEKEAQAHADKLKAIAKVTEYIYDNNLESDDQEYNNDWYHKYFFRYDSNFFIVSWVSTDSYKYYSPIPYIKDQKSAEQVLENCKEELLKIYK